MFLSRLSIWRMYLCCYLVYQCWERYNSGHRVFLFTLKNLYCSLACISELYRKNKFYKFANERNLASITFRPGRKKSHTCGHRTLCGTPQCGLGVRSLFEAVWSFALHTKPSKAEKNCPKPHYLVLHMW